MLTPKHLFKHRINIYRPLNLVDVTNQVPSEIVAYQLGVQPCPNLKEVNGIIECNIYNNRPYTYRAYPLIQFEHNQVGLSPMCSFVKDILKKIVCLDSSSFKDEIKTHNKKLKQLDVIKKANYMWPLNKKQWVPV